MALYKNSKCKIAIISFSSCEGCQFTILDKGRKFLELLPYLEIFEWKLGGQIKKGNFYDFAFIEGTPSDDQEIKFLEKIRKKSALLVALGNCAALGGIQEMKNWRGKEKISHFVYKNPKGISNPEIKPISNFVKVDFALPGCPINGEEFLSLIYDFLFGKISRISLKPVCWECQIKEFDCLLMHNTVCFGPWTIGGCGVICPKNGESCLACRGFLPEAGAKKILKTLSKIIRVEEIFRQLEIFGLKDEFEEKLKKKN